MHRLDPSRRGRMTSFQGLQSVVTVKQQAPYASGDEDFLVGHMPVEKEDIHECVEDAKPRSEYAKQTLWFRFELWFLSRCATQLVRPCGISFLHGCSGTWAPGMAVNSA
jgi:hypothetical protein